MRRKNTHIELYRILLICIAVIKVIECIWHFVGVPLLGAQIHSNEFQDMDTEKISSNYERMRLINKTENEIIVYFDPGLDPNFFNGNANISIIFHIYPKKIYSESLKIQRSFKRYSEYWNSYIKIMKNNVLITASEDTMNFRSTEIQDALKKILTEFDALS